MDLSEEKQKKIEEVKKETIRKFKSRKEKLIFDDAEFENCIKVLHDKHIKEYPSLDYIFKNITTDRISDLVYEMMDYQLPLEHQKQKIKFEFNNSKKCCLAPHSTLNFDTMGHMRVCCYNNTFILGEYPKTSIIDAWNSLNRKTFINKLSKYVFPSGCDNCALQVKQNNFSNGLFSSFDQYDEDIKSDFPVALNFDFGTICNFECIMCGGKWSSSIRKNREKLPPLKSPYDDEFVNQLKPFIENTVYANFLGGEPFLNTIYYKILNIFLVKNKYFRGNITTNGSIFNDKIENYFKNLPNLNVNISIDSLEEKTYQYIRKNGNYKTLIENIKKFKDLGRLNGIAICPMIQNIHELPNLIQFAVDNNLKLSLNTVFGHLGGKIKGIHENETENELVWKGINDKHDKIGKLENKELIPEVALHTLPKEKLKEIIDYLKEFSFVCNYFDNYGEKYNDFIKSLEFYLDETPKA